MTTGIVIGALAAFVIHPPNWGKVWDRVNRLLSVGVKPKDHGLIPLPPKTEEFIASYADPPWKVDTRELQIQLRHWAFEE